MMVHKHDALLKLMSTDSLRLDEMEQQKFKSRIVKSEDVQDHDFFDNFAADDDEEAANVWSCGRRIALKVVHAHLPFKNLLARLENEFVLATGKWEPAAVMSMLFCIHLFLLCSNCQIGSII